MMQRVVLVGATGNLGGKITDALLKKGAEVTAIVRMETDEEKVIGLREKGVEVHRVDMASRSEIAKHCKGAGCVVSALAGLEETVIDAQKIVADAAIEANVKRFIPSDYSIDFTNLVEGQNRNLDWRRDFHTYLEGKPIEVTTIFNGPFMELLTTDMPLILFKQKKILCWGNPDQIMEFTTTLNIAEFTAEAALDRETPRYLRIAGDRLSCNDFVELLTKITGERFKLFRPGGIGLLNVLIKVTRFFSPSKQELYPAWQGMQYMRDMMEGRVVFQDYDNERYPDIEWTDVESYLSHEDVLSRLDS
ncbi:MAG: NAD-dependent epimerase/dehydratase family protein [Balneolaceae bacterium]|nr:MAG: NAD-dependent epimerase/dehydratase family protein [Balneolaceae bacterium]